MIPGFEWPYIYDVRARPNVIQSTSGSRDLQMVNLPPASSCTCRGHLCCMSSTSRETSWILRKQLYS